MPEFTGERVIPGQVDEDLWNEHRSRYLFASRLCRQKNVLDLGCGTGYGTAELASQATFVTGIDRSADAIDHARTHYQQPNVTYLRGDATSLPFRGQNFDLVVAFEIIEHIDRWQDLVDEASRVLSPGGQLVVSTPNKVHYAETRRSAGPNPFHAHEFEFQEFQDALTARFPHVSIFLQNHEPSITFQPLRAVPAAYVSVESGTPDPDASGFFIAVCAATPQTGGPAFVHIPKTANALLQRERHILLLESELAQKNTWLHELEQDHAALVDSYRTVQAELEERNTWAEQLDTEITEARQDIDRLNTELTERAEQYEHIVSETEAERDKQTRWAQQTQQTLDDKIKELAACVDKLHETERTVEERTAWAQKLDAELQSLQHQLSRVKASRWMRIGRTIGVGPEVRQS